jgi:hypothetical protein
MISLSRVEGYVKNGLKKALRSDLRKLKILKEADVECCAYHHLRKFMRGDKSWRVFARKYSSRTGYYTDLIIFREKKARIAIEIKWRRNTISGKDRRALRNVRRKLGVKKTYFYCVLADGSSYEKLTTKRSTEKYRLFERIVDLGYKDQEKIDEWRKERSTYRK